ncbi:MAG: glycosyltransferase family 4 protein [Actinomycetota bacterium]|nr:glycosyltransferase family 4 protein [Actinomycetota bacterium]
MRIGIIAPPWLPVPATGYGGTEAVVDQLARGLAAAGHDVLLVCHPDSTCPVPRASVVPAADSTRMGRAATELEHAIGAYELVRDCDVVHDHTLAGPLYSERFPELVVVATNHQPFDRPRNAVYGACPHVALVAISNAHAASTDLPVAAVVHHGIDLAEYPQGDGGSGHLAVLGRMTPDKGIDRAIGLARAAGLPLKIAAKMREPGERRYFDEAVRPLLGDGVEYLGEVDGNGKRLLLGSAMALLNPIAWAEPFGMAVLESMACGTPVIACPRGAMPELVQHGRTGFLGETDEELLAGLRMVDQLDRDVCRQVVGERFSVSVMVTGYLRVYSDAIAARSRSGAFSH